MDTCPTVHIRHIIRCTVYTCSIWKNCLLILVNKIPTVTNIKFLHNFFPNFLWPVYAAVLNTMEKLSSSESVRDWVTRGIFCFKILQYSRSVVFQHARMVFNFFAALVNRIRKLPASLATRTNSEDCSESCIKIFVPAFLLCHWSLLSVSASTCHSWAYGIIYKITGGIRWNLFESYM